MCDYFDDFEDNFDNDDFEDEDSFEDEYNADTEMDEPFADDAKLEDKPDQAESKDDKLTVDPFFIGGAMGFAFSEGLREGKRRKLKKKSSDDSD